MKDNELVNGTSYVFCGTKWASLVPIGRPDCLTEADVTSMDYFISGVEDRGVIAVPSPGGGSRFPRWKIAVIVVCTVVGLALIALVAVFAFRKYFHVLVLSKKGGDEW